MVPQQGNLPKGNVAISPSAEAANLKRQMDDKKKAEDAARKQVEQRTRQNAMDYEAQAYNVGASAAVQLNPTGRRQNVMDYEAQAYNVGASTAAQTNPSAPHQNATTVTSVHKPPRQSELAISEQERLMAKAGDVRGFWESRKAKGDPIAGVALKSINPQGGIIDSLFGGRSINDRLEAFSRVYADKSINLEQVRKDLVRAHVRAVDQDRISKLGLLDPGQVYDYHKDVFSKYGLPSTAFGGSPFTGDRWESYLTRGVWCSDCDH